MLDLWAGAIGDGCFRPLLQEEATLIAVDKGQPAPHNDFGFGDRGGGMTTTQWHDAERDREIGARLKERRLEKGLSLQALAGRLDVSYEQIRKYELGRDAIKASTLERIAEELDAPPIFFHEPPIDTARPRPSVNELAGLASRIASIEDISVRDCICRIVERATDTRTTLYLDLQWEAQNDGQNDQG